MSCNLSSWGTRGELVKMIRECVSSRFYVPGINSIDDIYKDELDKRGILMIVDPSSFDNEIQNEFTQSLFEKMKQIGVYSKWYDASRNWRHIGQRIIIIKNGKLLKTDAILIAQILTIDIFAHTINMTDDEIIGTYEKILSDFSESDEFVWLKGSSFYGSNR